MTPDPRQVDERVPKIWVCPVCDAISFSDDHPCSHPGYRTNKITQRVPYVPEATASRENAEAVRLLYESWGHVSDPRPIRAFLHERGLIDNANTPTEKLLAILHPDPAPEERHGGTGKTSGHLRPKDDGWYDLGEQRIYCRDGRIAEVRG